MNVAENLCQNFFIPGGPCISGKYWEFYLQNSKISGSSVTLFNHDDEYDRTLKTNYTEVVESLVKSLVQQESRNINLIAHSFGAWVALSAFTDPRVNSKVENVILISLPLKTAQDTALINKFNERTTISAEDNESFRLYWEAIFPLYVSKPLTEAMEKKITEQVFWEGNENITLEESELEKLIPLTNDARVKLIYGQNDMITPPSSSLKCHIIPGAGHFPMLECSEKFTQVLKRCLTSSLS